MATYLSLVLLFACVSTASSNARSCGGRCGQGYYRGSLCQCDYECLGLNECCTDFQDLCTTKDSCKGRCGEPFNRGNPCHCDIDCVSYSQCCPDYESMCLMEDSALKSRNTAAAQRIANLCLNIKNSKTTESSNEEMTNEEGTGDVPGEYLSEGPYTDSDLVKKVNPENETSSLNPSTLPPILTADPSNMIPADENYIESATQEAEDPSNAAPTKDPSAEDPTSAAPANDRTSTAPAEDPTSAAPAEVPTSAAPAEDPTSAAPAEDPTTAAPAEVPTTAAPAEVPTSAAPAEDPTSAAPAEDPTSAAPAEDPTSAAPAEDPTSAAPAEDPTSGAPAEDPTSAAPAEDPTSAAPAEDPTSTAPVEVPTSAAQAEDPTNAAAAEGPSAKDPTSGAPPEVPTSAAPVEGPTAEDPTSAAPGEVPTSATPAEDPTSAAPGEVPTSATPAEDPTSAAPAGATTVPGKTPSTSAPMKPTKKPTQASNDKSEQKESPKEPIVIAPIRPAEKPLKPENNGKTDSILDYQADDYDTNLCSGRPVSGMTTLSNGTIVVFRGHYFWTLDKQRNPDPPRLITQVWGIPSPIDTVYTRCNCEGKTYFFKGRSYWRFENGEMDPGFPKPINEGFGRIGHVTAALSIPLYRSRKESVIFFRRGGMAQKYTYQVTPDCGRKPRIPVITVRMRARRQAGAALGPVINISKTWGGFPTMVTSAVSVPSRVKEGYKYYVFSQTKYYSMKMEREKPVILKPVTGPKENSANSFFKCKDTQ